MARKTTALALVVPALVAALTACTSSGGSDPAKSPTSTSVSSVTSSPPTTASTTTTPSSTAPGADPRGKAATAAYLAFVAADYQAERKPKDLALSAALKRYAVDPALAQAGQFLFQFRQSNWEWRGTPPNSRTTVKSIDSTGQYPTVTIFDCPTTSSTWRPYDAATGKPVQLVKPKVAPPWGTTATIILYKNRWMVQTAKTDMTRTCKP